MLRRSAMPHDTSAHGADPATASPTCLRILIADDHPGMAKALARLLAPDHDVVGVVSDGGAVVDAALHLQPDIMLVDVTLPHVSGIEICRQIAESSLRTRVIMMTGLFGSAVRDRALEVGAAAFLSKGTAGAELLSAIRQAMSTR